MAQAASSRCQAASSAGKSEPVVPRRRGKAAHQNPGTGEMVEQIRCLRALRTGRTDRCRRAIAGLHRRECRRAGGDRPPAASASRRSSLVAQCQVAISQAGPDTGQSPSSRRQAAASGSVTTTKPTRKPARPKNLPSERSTMVPDGQLRHRQQRQVRVQIGKGFVDDQPSPARGPGQCECRRDRRCAMVRPSGLLGLTTIRVPKPCPSGVRQRASSWTWPPASRQAAACEP